MVHHRNGRKAEVGGAPRKAFTLLELLVVIAIIALLISILLPSLEAARRASKNAACLAHIKNIATSSLVYEADDPSGWGIPVHPKQYEQDPNNPIFVGAYQWGGKSGIGWTRNYPGAPASGSQIDVSNSRYGTRAGFGPASRPLNNILYPGGFKDNSRDRRGQIEDTKLQLDLYKCPADDGPPRGAHCQEWIKESGTSSYDFFGNSYAANIFMIGSSAGGCFLSNSPYLRPTSRVPTPARTLYYEENIGRWAWACRREQCDFIQPGVDPGPSKHLRSWHGRDWTYNRAFVDAHAETQRIYIEGTEDNQGYAEHYTNERLSSYPPFIGSCEESVGADDSSHDQRAVAYRCIIVRGNGWQKDTMPSPFIQTGLQWRPSGNNRPSYEDCVQPGQ